MMRIKFYKTPSATPRPSKFYYRSGEVTKVMKITPKTRKSADQRNNLILEVCKYARIIPVGINKYSSSSDPTGTSDIYNIITRVLNIIIPVLPLE